MDIAIGGSTSIAHYVYDALSSKDPSMCEEIAKTSIPISEIGQDSEKREERGRTRVGIGGKQKLKELKNRMKNETKFKKKKDVEKSKAF